MIIAHNMAAMNANRIVGINNNAIQKSTTKLSSGYRINVAADDAAGLTISEKMRSQVRGLKRASDNAQDGISLIQTAEGAVGQIHDLIHRIRELAVQGANDTNVTEDRDAIQREIDELVKQVDYVSDTTQFNGMNLLDGSWANPDAASQPLMRLTQDENGGYQAVEVKLKALGGDNDGQSVSLQDVMSAEGLTIIYDESEFVTNQTGTGDATATDAKYDTIKNVLQQQIVPQAVKSLLAAFPDTFGYLSSSAIGIGLKLENNPGSTTLASVTMSTSAYTDGTVIADTFSYKLTVNTAGVLDADGNMTDATRSALETTIVHEMTHALMDETLTNGMLGVKDGKVDAGNSFPGWFKEGMAQAAAGGCSPYNDWVNGGGNGLGLTATSSLADISSVVKNSSNSLASNTTPSQYGTGYLACMYLGYLIDGGSSVNAGNIANGLDKLMTELKSGKGLDEVIANHTSYTGVSDFQNKFGDSASAQFVKNLLTAVGDAGNGGLVGGYTSADPLPDSNYSTNLFKLNVVNDTIKNTYPSDVEKLTDGGLTGNTSTGGAGGTGGTGGGTGGTGGGAGGGTGTPTARGGLNLQVGANKDQSMKVYIENMDAATLGIDSLSVASHTDAGSAIDATDKAIVKVSRQRSLLGAYQNRLEYSIKNSDNGAENLQAAESRIRDLDMADEMVIYSKNQILLQASQSMMSQAGRAPESILQLLN